VTIVTDASVVVASLLDTTRTGRWAEHLLESESLRAPHLFHAEAANSLRRAALTGAIAREAAARAYDDLLDLRVELSAFEPLARRIWELRHNVSTYDAWYVALAEALDAPLATLDRRLAMAVGPRCSFLLPPA
jgi:predicted nucleic acid-binding protein